MQANVDPGSVFFGEQEHGVEMGVHVAVDLDQTADQTRAVREAASSRSLTLGSRRMPTGKATIWTSTRSRKASTLLDRVQMWPRSGSIST